MVYQRTECTGLDRRLHEKEEAERRGGRTGSELGLAAVLKTHEGGNRGPEYIKVEDANSETAPRGGGISEMGQTEREVRCDGAFPDTAFPACHYEDFLHVWYGAFFNGPPGSSAGHLGRDTVSTSREAEGVLMVHA